MAASLSDILTALQNGVKSINSAAQTLNSIYGAQTASNISALTLVSSNSGRLAMVSITTPGTANGTVYDSNSTLITTTPIFVIPQTLGIIFINLPVAMGIVVSPGTGQVCSVSWA